MRYSLRMCCSLRCLFFLCFVVLLSQTFHEKAENEIQKVISSLQINGRQAHDFVKLFFKMPPTFIEIALFSLSTTITDHAHRLPIRVCFAHFKEVVESYFMNPLLTRSSLALAKGTSSDLLGLLLSWRRRR